MKVREVMQTEVITAPIDLTYEAAARLLYDNKISGAPVVDENGSLVGVLSEKDLIKLLYPIYKDYFDHPEVYLDFEGREGKIEELKLRPLSEIIDKTMHIIHPDAPVLKAGSIMLAHNLHRLPVVESGKLVGIVTRDHIFRGILKKHLPLA